ncbi:hypothetical protein VTI74DRAFT_2323 [Chaetomium olivicolor]
MPAAEWARIKGASTTTINGRPVPERLNPFPLWTLPETMQDVITISRSLGYSCTWIDNVFIPKGTNWDIEASLMHEVYGNVAFTLAWTYRNKACKLHGLWLHSTIMPLDRVCHESPVAQRAWTLQEERLSPRIVYWSSQQWYWSCSERQAVEAGDLRCTSDRTTRSGPQRFLELCETGDEPQLHEEWLDIVEAYTRRDLVDPKDRFLAIAGLAVRFYNAKAVDSVTLITEDYLADLWRDNFARHLVWSVVSAATSYPNLQHIAPSWSWASLPLRFHTKTKFAFAPFEDFKFIAVEYIDCAFLESSAIRADRSATDYVDRGRAVEERGRGVKVVEVEGRVRRFIFDNAQEVSWDAIEWRRMCNLKTRVGFAFSAFPGQHIYARNKADGVDDVLQTRSL